MAGHAFRCPHPRKPTTQLFLPSRAGNDPSETFLLVHLRAWRRVVAHLARARDGGASRARGVSSAAAEVRGPACSHELMVGVPSLHANASVSYAGPGLGLWLHRLQPDGRSGGRVGGYGPCINSCAGTLEAAVRAGTKLPLVDVTRDARCSRPELPRGAPLSCRHRMGRPPGSVRRVEGLVQQWVCRETHRLE